MPILTVIELPIEQVQVVPSYNFREAEWDDFQDELEARLVDIPSPAVLSTEGDFSEAVKNLTGIIQDMFWTTVPQMRPCPNSKWWWSKELGVLKKWKNKLSSTSYKYRAMTDHPSHEEHRKIWREYSDAIA